jgi:hypothetical protein
MRCHPWGQDANHLAIVRHMVNHNLWERLNLGCVSRQGSGESMAEKLYSCASYSPRAVSGYHAGGSCLVYCRAPSLFNGLLRWPFADRVRLFRSTRTSRQQSRLRAPISLVDQHIGTSAEVLQPIPKKGKASENSANSIPPAPMPSVPILIPLERRRCRAQSPSHCTRQQQAIFTLSLVSGAPNASCGIGAPCKVFQQRRPHSISTRTTPVTKITIREVSR